MAKEKQIPNVVFKRKTTSFSMVANPIIDDKTITPAAGWLYVLIQRWITFNAEDFVCSKAFLFSKYSSGEKMFNRAWNELKEKGYLKMYCVGKSTWSAELLDEPQPDTPHTYYLNTAGEITATNIDIVKKLAKIKKAKETNKENNDDLAESDLKVPQKGAPLDLRVPQKGIPLKGVPLKGTPLQGGNNINTSSKNSINTFSYTNQSINHNEVAEEPAKPSKKKNDRLIDGESKKVIDKKLLEQVKDQINYDHLIAPGAFKKVFPPEELNSIVTAIAMLKTVTEPQEIGGTWYDPEIIRERADSIRDEHVEYVFNCLEEKTDKINNIVAYLKTAVFNAPATIGAYISNEVNVDKANYTI